MNTQVSSPEEALLRGAHPPPPQPAANGLRCAATLYLEYAPILRRIGSRKFDIPLADVDALVHDVFATYLTNPATVRDPRSYLVGGICNAAREYWRERRREVSLDEGEDAAIPEGIFDGLSERLTVAATVARLRSRCRDLLRRRYFEDEATEAIAAAFDTTPRNVLYLLHICRARARKIYEALTRVR
jgi:DNA-directed RNA polymerase specialized sigma24 family protein